MRVAAWLTLWAVGCGGVPAATPPDTGTAAAGCGPLKVGVYLADPEAQLAAYEESVGRRQDQLLWYQSIQEHFDANLATWLWGRGTALVLAWELVPAAGQDPGEVNLRALADGTVDAELVRWADAMRDFGHPLYLRPLSEMNQGEELWAGTANGNTPGDFVPAWRHLREVFDGEGATNVVWVFDPGNVSGSRDPRDAASSYYPGDAYVDWMGINGYNWGAAEWQSFDEVFGATYAELAPAANLLSRGASSFEDGAEAPVAIGDGGVVLTDEVAWDGKRSAHVTGAGAAMGLDVAEPGAVTFAAAVRGAGAVRLAVDDGSDASFGEWFDLSTAWERTFVTGRVAAGTVEVRVEAAAGAPLDLWIDAVAITKGERPHPYTWEDKPVMLGEFASTEEGGDKAVWIREVFAALPVRFPRVRSLNWFGLDKERPWSVGSSPASLAAMRHALACQ